jgi:uncharacterized membrane protein YkoI
MAMNRTARLAAISLMLAFGALSAADAFASDRHRAPEGGGDRVHADRAISLDEAVARAERQYKARAVRAEEKHHGDRIEYRIRLLGEDGRVFEVRVDAASGRED